MAFFLRFKSLTVVMIAMIGALFCSSLELVLTYNSETNVLPCHASFVSSNSGALAVVAVQVILLIVIVVLLVAALMCKHKEEHDEHVIAGPTKSVVSILVVGALSTICVIILSISHHQSTTYLFTYSNLTIIYSTKSCLISVLAVVTCPISKAMLRSLLTNKKMKAKVNTVPRDQLYCSIALRNPPKVRENTSQNLASTGESRAITSVLLDDAAEKAGKKYQKLREAKALRDSLIRTISIVSHELQRRSKGNRGAPTKQYLEIAKLHRVTTTAQVQRLLIRFKDELKIVTSDVETKQQALRRLRERQRGYPAVAREPREKESDVPFAEVREHWKAIIGETQPFHPSDDLNEWAREQQTDSRDVGDLSDETWAKIFSKIKPWKATGPDGIQGFWWKKLPEAKERLKAWCLEALRKPHRIIPNWVCRGKIVLIPKGNSEARGPGDFRPIACLNTCYKVLTAMIAQQILQSAGDALPREQVALRKGVWGCTHAHILDQTICKDALRRKNTLHTLWVDMTKAFDSVSHGAIKWILKRAGVPSLTRRLLSVILTKQSVRYCGYQNGKLVKSEPLEVKRGVMQGDTLSPLLFCMAIAPISTWLRNNVSPYRTSTGALTLACEPLTINHIFYMDDLKVYSPSWDDIVKAKEGIQKVAGELGLRLNPSKCAVNSLNQPRPNEMTPSMDDIPVLGSNSLYNDHQTMDKPNNPTAQSTANEAEKDNNVRDFVFEVIDLMKKKNAGTITPKSALEGIGRSLENSPSKDFLAEKYPTLNEITGVRGSEKSDTPDKQLLDRLAGEMFGVKPEEVTERTLKEPKNPTAKSTANEVEKNDDVRDFVNEVVDSMKKAGAGKLSPKWALKGIGRSLTNSPSRGLLVKKYPTLKEIADVPETEESQNSADNDLLDSLAKEMFGKKSEEVNDHQTMVSITFGS
nr:RNA-directed DNA polymerase (reverse transcriptase) domain containing protein [Haemonchus contortus]